VPVHHDCKQTSWYKEAHTFLFAKNFPWGESIDGSEANEAVRAYYQQPDDDSLSNYEMDIETYLQQWREEAQAACDAKNGPGHCIAVLDPEIVIVRDQGDTMIGGQMVFQIRYYVRDETRCRCTSP
jgi:hypothetical protein